MQGHSAVQVSGTGATQQEALRRREANYLKRMVNLGKLPASALKKQPHEVRMTMAELLEAWMEAKKDPSNDDESTLRDSVAAQYASVIRLHLVPHIGSIPVRQLDSEGLRELFKSTLPEKRKVVAGRLTDMPLLGPSPLRTAHNIINMALDYAVRRQLIEFNPAANLKMPKKAVAKREDFAQYRREMRKVILALEGTPEESQWLLSYMGLRQSERLGMTWDCFTHLGVKGRAVMEIRQQLARNPETGGLFITPETKTSAGRRIVPLDEPFRKILVEHQKRQQEQKKQPGWKPLPGMENLVFTTSTGKPIRHQTDNKQWKKLLADNGVEPFRGHALRHIAVSTMIEANISISVVGAIVGHGSESITRAVYMHLSTGPMMPAMEALTAKLLPRNVGNQVGIADALEKETGLKVKRS